MNIFIDEWKNFEFIDHDLLMKSIKNPFSIVPVFEHQTLDEIPSYLNSPQNETEELQYAIQVFLTLRTLIITLNKNQSEDLIQQYPFSISEKMLKTGIFV